MLELRDSLTNEILVRAVDRRGRNPSRQENAAANLIAFGGDRPLGEVDIPWSEAYTAARRSGKLWTGKRLSDARKHATDATIRRELVVLVAAGNHALARKRIDVSEKPSVKMPREVVIFDGEDDTLPGQPFFSREQITQLIDLAAQETADPKLEMMRWIRVCYYTAARRRSVEQMMTKQVVFSRRKINLATPGKIQTKKRQPVVPIFKAIEEDLRVLCAGKGPADRLFRPRSFYREFMALCRALDFPEPHHPHMLRHSRATHLLQDGKSIWDVAKLLGDTVATVELNYGHHAPDDLRAALE